MGTVKQLYKKKDKMRIWMTRGDIQESKRKNLIRCTPCEKLMRGIKFIKEVYKMETIVNEDI